MKHSTEMVGFTTRMDNFLQLKYGTAYFLNSELYLGKEVFT